MRIKNLTNYDNKDLRQLFQAVLNRFPACERKPNSRRWPLKVTVTYSNYGKRRESVGVGGMAYLGVYRLIMKLPRDFDPDPRVVAGVFDHELWHCAGYDHRAMGIETKSYVGYRDLFAWASDYPLRKKSTLNKGKEA